MFHKRFVSINFLLNYLNKYLVAIVCDVLPLLVLQQVELWVSLRPETLPLSHPDSTSALAPGLSLLLIKISFNAAPPVFQLTHGELQMLGDWIPKHHNIKALRSSQKI